jgi:predicted RNase H-like nuclease (RuvC/YqgF family)
LKIPTNHKYYVTNIYSCNYPNGGNILVYKNTGSEGIKESNLIFKTQKSSRTTKGIIVGYDPGLTVGIAILNLNGELISLDSFKEIRRSEIISHIIGYGNTVLVATDVYPAPKTVRKIATTLNSKIWSPYKNMSVESKIEIVDSFTATGNSLNVPQNAHERDSLAAALKTYKDHLNKFRQIEKRAEELSLTQDMVDNVKILVINGKSISNSLREVSQQNVDTGYIGNLNHKSRGSSKSSHDEDVLKLKNSTKDPETHNREMSPEELTISRLKTKLNSQKRYITELKEKNQELEDEVKFHRTEVSKLQSKMDKLRNEYSKKILEKREFASKISMIKRLQNKYSQEKSKRLELEKQLDPNFGLETIGEDAVQLKIINFFTREGIRESSLLMKISKGDIVLLENSEGGGSNTATILCEMGVKAVITRDKISDPAENVFKNCMIPVIPEDSIRIKRIADLTYVESEDIGEQINVWMEKTRKQQKTEDKNKLISLVDEYRAQRRRELDS